MAPRWRQLLFAASMCAVLVWTQAPLWGVALVPGDRHWEAETGPQALALQAYASLGVSGDDATLPAVRIAGCLLVALLALVAASVARRVLRPFTVESVAQAAGEASALYVAAHPLVVAAAARPKAHADLLGCALLALSLALLLRARQSRVPLQLPLAAAYGFCAALLSPTARVLPLLYALAEYGAGPRPRKLSARLRSALLAFVAAVALVVCGELLGRWLSGGDPLRFVVQQGAEGGALRWLETLGFVYFPAHQGTGVWGGVAAAVVWLLAIEPLLRAARSAPRLWGKLLLAAFAAAIVALPWSSGAQPAGRLDGAETLAAAGASIAVALAIATTAISGLRRTLLPVVGVLCLGWLARAAAADMADAARAADALEARLEAESRGVLELLVVDPPREHAGFPLWRDSIAERGPVKQTGQDKQTGQPPAARIRAVDGRDLGRVLRSPGFAAARRDGAAVLRPEGSARRVPFAAGASDSAVWRGEGRSPLLELDPLAAVHVRVLTLPGTAAEDAPSMGWRGVDDQPSNLRASGLWGLVDGAPVAIFDMSAVAGWSEARILRRAWFEAPLTTLKSAEIQPRPPYSAAPPLVDGDDWRVESVDESWQPSRGAAECRAVALTRDGLALVERPLLRDGDGWRARGMESELRRRLRRGEEFDWWIERFVDGTVAGGCSGSASR